MMGWRPWDGWGMSIHLSFRADVFMGQKVGDIAQCAVHAAFLVFHVINHLAFVVISPFCFP